MNLRRTIPWLLVGGLLASTAFNLHLVSHVNRLERDLATRRTPEPAALPVAVVKELGLTSAQKQTIRCCSDDCNTACDALSREAEACAARLRQALRDAEADPAKIEDLAEQLGELQVQQLVRLAKTIAKVRAALTPEQRARLGKTDD